jgi:hypothetical protein
LAPPAINDPVSIPLSNPQTFNTGLITRAPSQTNTKTNHGETLSERNFLRVFWKKPSIIHLRSRFSKKCARLFFAPGEADNDSALQNRYKKIKFAF